MSSQSEAELDTITPPADPNYEVLMAAIAELHYFVRDERRFDFKGNVVVQIVHPVHSGQFEYMLLVWQGGKLNLAHRIATSMNQHWAQRTQSLTWNYESESGTQSSWCVALHKGQPFEEFKELVTQAMWESLHQQSWAKAKVCLT